MFRGSKYVIIIIYSYTVIHIHRWRCRKSMKIQNIYTNILEIRLREEMRFNQQL